MESIERTKRVLLLEMELLELFERREEFTQSDFQGALNAWVRANCN